MYFVFSEIYNDMKVRIFALILSLGVISGFSRAAPLTTGQSVSKIPDSVNVFYGELFKALKRGYLHRKSLDWKTIERETYIKLFVANQKDVFLSKNLNRLKALSSFYFLAK